MPLWICSCPASAANSSMRAFTSCLVTRSRAAIESRSTASVPRSTTRLVGLDRAGRHVDAELGLGAQHRDPELPLEHDLVRRRPQRRDIAWRRTARRGRPGSSASPVHCPSRVRDAAADRGEGCRPVSHRRRVRPGGDEHVDLDAVAAAAGLARTTSSSAAAAPRVRRSSGSLCAFGVDRDRDRPRRPASAEVLVADEPPVHRPSPPGSWPPARSGPGRRRRGPRSGTARDAEAERCSRGRSGCSRPGRGGCPRDRPGRRPAARRPAGRRSCRGR